MAQTVELIEILPGKLYFASSPSGSPPSSPAASHTHVQLVDVTRECRYAGFYLDFGPLSLGHAIRFARQLDALLARMAEHADARVCVYASSGSAKASSARLRQERLAQQSANAACILGCWAVLSLGWSAERAFAPFKHLPLPLFHDATRGPDSFGLSVLHVLHGLEKAVQAQLVSPATFDLDEYFHFEQVAHGDLSWISPHFVAFAGPHDFVGASGRLTPEHYVEHFKRRGVALVVRLSRKRYDKERFTSAGFQFADLYFPDGTNPPEAVLQQFLQLCESTATGAVAVHCKAGLGRTGTLIACSLMQQHRFSAEEAIGWLRLCRPGSVVGQQQHYLRVKQQQLWDSSPLRTKGPGAVNQPASPVESERATVRKEGIAARPRRRSSLSVGGCALLKKVDQLCSGSGGPKSSHSISPAVRSSSNGVSKTVLLPPRIPAKSSLPLAGKDEDEEIASTSAIVTGIATGIATESVVAAALAESASATTDGSTMGESESRPHRPRCVTETASASGSARKIEDESVSETERFEIAASTIALGSAIMTENASVTTTEAGRETTSETGATIEIVSESRTQQRSQRGYDEDDPRYEDTIRRKQLKDELGLSDEEEDNTGDEDGSSGAGSRGGKQRARGAAEVSGQAGKEVLEQLEQLKRELQQARESEQKAQESLSKLQLLSKSQTAILKTTMTRKIQEKENELEEMSGAIKDLEAKLETAGIGFEAYAAPHSIPSSSSSTPSSSGGTSAELDVAAEIGAMEAEIDRLTDENKALKLTAAKAATAASAAKAVQPPAVAAPKERSPAKDDTAMRAKLEALEAEKLALAQQLKAAQQKLVEIQAAPPVPQSAVLPPSPLSATPGGADELRTLQKKLAGAESSQQSSLKTIQRLEKELAVSQQAATSSSSDAAKTFTAAAAAAETAKEASKAEESYKAQVKKLETEVETAKASLEQQAKASQAKETALEDKNAKLKATAEAELAKIKEQAKKAILELKKRLESTSKDQQQKRNVLGELRRQLQKQKTDMSALKTQVAAQNQQFPVLAKQLTDKITQRVQKQTDAMAGVVENYKREMKERKRLFNLVQELKGNIRVLCRVRPISKPEISSGSKMVCKFTNEEITLAGDKGKMKTWEFDRVFDMNSTQDQLFSEELFERKTQRSKEYQDEITVSVMEIYNEQIRDLLAQDAANTNLQVRQGPTGNFVPGLTVVPVHTLDEVFELIKKGNKNRSTHATDMNEHSSRSHSILSIQIKSLNIVTSATK
ncbi:hypothetical protein PybrP1_003569 [[Pythium] brassicae (nom. inval.)]|nr:hypothetical protein PybrP1_003569 [[Pythium] brassicae (nom. inval.)]